MSRVVALAFALFVFGGCASVNTRLRGGARGDRVVELAREQLGRPYHYGGSEPGAGFDCSGLVGYVFKSLGVKLPHSTAALYREGSRVGGRELLPGDLVFYDIQGGGVSHVGIYSGEGRMVHAPSSGGKVSEVDIGIKYWTKRFAGARRID